MLINILIRTSYRPAGFARCLASVQNQSYKNIRILVSYDNWNALKYIPEGIEKIKVLRGPGTYFYDSYCNELKSKVNEGYFLFIDDDDYLANPKIISMLIPYLSQDSGLLVQLKRGSTIRPESGLIESGKIGMPCLILHHSHKDLANIPPTGQGDYHWILQVSNLIELRFVPLIVVHSDRRGNGKQERPVR